MLKTSWDWIVDKKIGVIFLFCYWVMVLKMSKKGSFFGASEKSCCTFEKYGVMYLLVLFLSWVNGIGN